MYHINDKEVYYEVNKIQPVKNDIPKTFDYEGIKMKPKLLIKKKVEPCDFGENLYTVLVTQAVSKSQEIQVWADEVEISEHGDLVFISLDNEGNQEYTFSVAQGYWKSFFITNEKTNLPKTVEKWAERIIPAPEPEPVVEEKKEETVTEEKPEEKKE